MTTLWFGILIGVWCHMLWGALMAYLSWRGSGWPPMAHAWTQDSRKPEASGHGQSR